MTQHTDTLDDLYEFELEASSEAPQLPVRIDEDLAGQGNIHLPGTLLGDPYGHISGFMKSSQDLSMRPSSAQFLPEGRTMSVPEGRAIVVMMPFRGFDHQPVWRSYQFPVGGTLKGPLVWAYDKAQSQEDLLMEACDGWLLLAVAVGAFAGLGGAIAAAINTSVLDINNPAVMILAVLGGGATSFCMGGWAGHAATWNAIKRLADGKKILASASHHSEQNRLSERIKDMSDYLVGGPSQAAASAIQKSPDIDIQIAQALSDYRPLWRRAKDRKEDIDRATFQMLAHSASLIGSLAKRIRSEPELLRNDDIRTSFRSLIERARADVETAMERQAIAAEASVLGDIKALLRQLDQHGTT